MIISWAICVAWFFVFSVFPVKALVGASVLMAYVLYEFTMQGWNGLDTVEDSTFVGIYGPGFALGAFHEIKAGSAAAYFDVLAPIPIFSVMVMHLIAGCVWREYQRRKGPN